jgi:hypothetical protein
MSQPARPACAGRCRTGPRRPVTRRVGEPPANRWRRQAHGTEALAPSGPPCGEPVEPPCGGPGERAHRGRTSCPHPSRRRRPRQGRSPCGDRQTGVDVNRAQQGGGSEATLTRPPLAGPSHLLRHTARQRCAAVHLRVAFPLDVLVFVPGSGSGHAPAGLPTRHARVQDSSRRASPPRCCLLRTIRVSSGMVTPWSSAPHLLTPALAGGGDAGRPFRADRRAPRPRCVLADLDLHRRSCRCSQSPRRPVVNRSRLTLACSTRSGVAPVSSLLMLHAAPETARPDGRTSDRTVSVQQPALFVARRRPPARPDRSPCVPGPKSGRPGPKSGVGEYPQAADHREDQRTPRPLPDVGAGPRRCLQPTASRPSVHRHRPLPMHRTLPSRRPRTTGCPGDVGGKGAPGPSPTPSEGVATLAGYNQGRGSSARLVLPGSGRRRGRHGLGRPSPRGLACVAGRGVRASPSRGPVGRDRRSGDHRRCGVVAASVPGDPGLPRTLRRVAFFGSLERRSESFVRPLMTAACAACRGGRAPGKIVRTSKNGPRAASSARRP